MNVLRKMQAFFSKWQLLTKLTKEEANGETQTKLELLKVLIKERI